MFWVIQETTHERSEFAELCRVLQTFSLPFASVKVTKDGSLVDANQLSLEPVIPHDTPVFVLGTYALSRVAHQRGWHPGAIDTSNFTFAVCCQHWQDAMLNHGATTSAIRAHQPPTDQPFFARPLADSKAFNGQVFTAKTWIQFQRQVFASELPSQVLSPDTAILVSPIQTIYKEHRFFVVNGEIITGSLYKQGGKLTISSNVDPDAIAYAQTQVDRWQPAPLFVLDVATTPHGHRIVEINGLNSAGFYAANLGKLVMSIEDFYEPQVGPSLAHP